MTDKNEISTLLERLSRILQNDAHTSGLKPTQWAALRYLTIANRFSRTPKGLTAYLGMTKGTVSQTLIALERKGLIKKGISPTDRRNVHLELTAPALSLLEQDPIHTVDKLIVNFDEQTSTIIRAGLKGLLQEILRERNGKSFDLCKTCIHFRENANGENSHHCSLLNVPLTMEDSLKICVESEAA